MLSHSDVHMSLRVTCRSSSVNDSRLVRLCPRSESGRIKAWVQLVVFTVVAVHRANLHDDVKERSLK